MSFWDKKEAKGLPKEHQFYDALTEKPKFTT